MADEPPHLPRTGLRRPSRAASEVLPSPRMARLEVASAVAGAFGSTSDSENPMMYLASSLGVSILFREDQNIQWFIDMAFEKGASISIERVPEEDS